MLEILALAALATPSAPAVAVAVAVAVAGDPSIAWHRGTFDSALGKADKFERPVLAYFWVGGSGQCAKLYGETMADGRAIDEMNEFICFSADTATDAGYELVQRYNVKTLPTVLVIDGKGAIDDAILGFIPAEGFADELKRVQRGEKTVTDFRKKAEAAPNDIDAWYAFGVKLSDCGAAEAYDEVKGRLKTLDPKGGTPVVARMLMADVQEPIIAAVKRDDGEYAFEEADLAPMHAFLKKAALDEIRFEGWSWVAAVERKAERAKDARVASMTAWTYVPEEAVIDQGMELTRAFWEDREELDRKEKKFVLTVATQLNQAADAYLMTARAEAQEASGEGCGSWEGCSEGDGCGGCGGKKMELARFEVRTIDTLACAFYVNGKKKKAVDTLEKGLELEPESEDLQERLAMFKGKKKKAMKAKN